MKKFFLLSLIFSVCTSAYSQTTLICGTPSSQNGLSTTQRKSFTDFFNQSNQKNSGGVTTNSSSSFIPNDQVILIPVVVHVIHSGENIGSGTNISDDQICSQIDVLNEDFSRTNPDRVNTPYPFTDVASSPRIQFYLATVDPNGNPTNGITRTQTTRTQFSDNDDIKFNSTGGHDAWNANNYLNIWVSGPPIFTSQGQLAGYAQFPQDLGSKPNTDGVVIFNQSFGRGPFTFFPGYALGHTTTHEVGHWMSLLHIWGDDGTGCNGSDGLYDTPNQAGFSSGNPSFPHYDVCNTDFPGVMFMNYMDYSADNSRNMFTALQTNVMRFVFGPNQYRQNASYAVGKPIVGAEPVCNSSTFSVPNLPTGLSIIGWSSDNTNGLTIDGNGVATRQNGFNGQVNITATVAHSCGTITVTKTINVGTGAVGGTYTYGGTTYNVNGSTGISVSNTSNTISFNLASLWDPNAQYSWSVSTTGNVSHNLSNYPNGNITLGGGAQAVATCNVTTPCGIVSITFNCYNYSGGFRMAAYPNPASQDMTIVAIKGNDQQDATSQDASMAADAPAQDSDLIDIEADIRLVDKANTVIKQGKLIKGKLNFSVAQVPAGIYYLQMEFKDTKIQKQIVIQH